MTTSLWVKNRSATSSRSPKTLAHQQRDVPHPSHFSRRVVFASTVTVMSPENVLNEILVVNPTSSAHPKAEAASNYMMSTWSLSSAVNCKMLREFLTYCTAPELTGQSYWHSMKFDLARLYHSHACVQVYVYSSNWKPPHDPNGHASNCRIK